MNQTNERTNEQAARESRDAKMSEMKDLKSQTKFKSGRDRRQDQSARDEQSTTSLSLKVEKDLLKEVDDLKKQRKIRAALGARGRAGRRRWQGDYDAQIKDENDKLTKVKTEMEKHQVSQYTNERMNIQLLCGSPVLFASTPACLLSPLCLSSTLSLTYNWSPTHFNFYSKT